MSSLPPIHLYSDRLAVEIAQPGSAYAGTRFDWTAFITQVTLDGKHTFCVPESLEPGQGTGGIGLCNEFGIDMPIGYDDARAGDRFPKLGIGLLVRPDEAPYRFMRPYEISERFPVHVEASPDEAHFVVEPVECRGYAARLEKTVTVQGAQLEISYRLESVGSRTLHTVEYCHNFIGIDGHSIGPDYHLRVPYPIQFEPVPPVMLRQALPGVLAKIAPEWLLRQIVRGLIRRRGSILVVEGNELSLNAVPERPFYQRLLGYAQTNQAQWELVHMPSGMAVREFDDFIPVRVAMWGTTHVISTEVFIEIDLQPGEIQTWSRRYEFLGHIAGNSGC
jgi:hypothetical protein